jgi:hypothetical protein
MNRPLLVRCAHHGDGTRPPRPAGKAVRGPTPPRGSLRSLVRCAHPAAGTRPRRGSLRSFAAVALSAALGCGLLGAGCGEQGRSEDEVRRDYRKALLAADDRRQQREQKHEETRVQDQRGALIPSGERVAGLLLPRGLSLRLSFEREWYYETTLSAAALRAYFGPRLNTLEVVQGGGDTVTYQNAVPRDTPGAEHINVRIGPLPNQRDKTEVNIRMAPDATPPRSEAEARLELEMNAKYAD